MIIIRRWTLVHACVYQKNSEMYEGPQSRPLTCNDDVLGCQWHEFAHDIIPKGQVQDAEGAEVDWCMVGK